MSQFKLRDYQQDLNDRFDTPLPKGEGSVNDQTGVATNSCNLPPSPH